jgi:hypothetical protein
VTFKWSRSISLLRGKELRANSDEAQVFSRDWCVELTFSEILELNNFALSILSRLTVELNCRYIAKVASLVISRILGAFV